MSWWRGMLVEKPWLGSCPHARSWHDGLLQIPLLGTESRSHRAAAGSQLWPGIDSAKPGSLIWTCRIVVGKFLLNSPSVRPSVPTETSWPWRGWTTRSSMAGKHRRAQFGFVAIRIRSAISPSALTAAPWQQSAMIANCGCGMSDRPPSTTRSWHTEAGCDPLVSRPMAGLWSLRATTDSRVSGTRKPDNHC